MNQSVLRLLRAVAGVTVVLVLFFTVRGYWTEYQTAPRLAAPGASESSTATAGDQSSSSAPVESVKGTLIVLTDGLNLRTKPAIDGDQVRALDKKEKLVLLKKQGDWYYVSTSKEEEGWISANKSYTKLQK
jgi:uncharacterized protein YgiM (DUF1202 family)